MSNYYSKAKRPGSIVFEKVAMLDGYFTEHEYGVQFPDGKVYPEDKCKFEETPC